MSFQTCQILAPPLRGLLAWSLCLACSTTLCAAEQVLPQGLFVFGYVDQLSVVAGDELHVHLNSNAEVCEIRIERVGNVREPVWSRTNVPVQVRPIPDRASSDGCDWPSTVAVAIPEAWSSGYYEVLMSVQDGASKVQAKQFFVVRAAQPRSKILLQLATNTYNAYTNWGGHSLYAYHDRDGLQGHRVSFERPLTSLYDRWELPFVAWAEQQGFEIEYAINSDLEFHPELLEHYRLVLSVGHDEYWSAPMRDHLEAFIEAGGNVAFFSGNTCCWQVRSEEQGNALTCWKQWYNVDPQYRTSDHKLLSTAWSHHLVGRPENQLTGVGFLWGGYHLSHGQFMDGSGAYEVHRPEHWALAGTGLRQGDAFGGPDTIVGYECDGCELTWRDGLPYPTARDGTPADFKIIGTAPAKWAPGDSLWYDRFPADRVGAAVMGTYVRGGTVFTCGSTDWAHGLRGQDPIVSRITANVLTRLSDAETE